MSPCPGPHVLAVTYKDWDRAITNLMADFEVDTLLTGEDLVLGLDDDYAVGVDNGNLSPVISESLWSKVVHRCSELRQRVATDTT
jgi:basic membrane lipoprotein Med (substrate-binding protein (PBP1-ABC) superfamily)